MRRLLIVLIVWCAVPAGAQPVTYAWRLDCEQGKHFGPFGSPDACTAERNAIAGTCVEPTLVRDGKMVPNPIFVRIADICQESLNGRGCTCVYATYAAVPLVERPRGCSVGDLVRCKYGVQGGGVCTLDDRLRCARWLTDDTP